MKRVALECGGKSPHIVLPDCATSTPPRRRVAWGVFYNQGEVCNAGSRLLVHERRSRTSCSSASWRWPSAIQPGDPLDPKTRMGAIVDADAARARARLHRDRAAARAPSCTSAAAACARRRGGFFVEPTVFDARLATTCDRARGDLRPGALDDRRSTPRTRRSAIANDTDLRPRRGGLDERRRHARTASRARSAPASSGSTRSTRATSPRRSAASSSRASAATSRSTRSTSTPT